MGSSALPPSSSSPRDDETVLFLFIAFAILIVLLLLLVLVSCQTWMLWSMAKAVVEQDTQITSQQRGGRGGGGGYGSSDGFKRRSVRGSVYMVEREEESKLMSGGMEGKRRTGVWGWV
jgi:hypothetical protein